MKTLNTIRHRHLLGTTLNRRNLLKSSLLLAAGWLLGVAPTVHAAQPSLPSYITGTWVNSIGLFGGPLMQVKQVYGADGTYVVQVNYEIDARGMAHLVPWTTKDSGTWKVLGGVIRLTSTTGRVVLGYVRAVDVNVADIGTLAEDAPPGLQPTWMHFARLQ